MPRRVTRSRRATDRAAGLRNLALATMLLGPLPSPKRPDLAALDPVERDRVLDAEAADDRAEDRYLMWCLGVIDEDGGGPATSSEVERWTKRRRKAEKKARKAAKKRAADAEPDPLDPDPALAYRGTEPEETPTSRVPLIPPPATRPRRERGYFDEDD